MLKTLNDIRKEFVNYFVHNKHVHLPSSSLIPYNDPTLIFTNSGMVQFKNIFTGLEKPIYPRVVTSQKAVRAGGKHNDLENVGYTTRHHTFFEMLGNFSFGDYFKEEAIYYAWEFLTKTLHLPHDRLHATVYHTDDEAFLLWKKISTLPDEKIVKIATQDNFWSVGPVGPCGPCSEVFFDHQHGVGEDRYVEVWNMVFMQFEQMDDGTIRPLPQNAIDTGMGLERISAILQGVDDNYKIDLFRELIACSEDITQTKAAGELQSSHRVVADHLRASAFLLADGVTPSNEGRGYVLRRIIRRAVRHAYQMGYREPLLVRMLPKLCDMMGGAYHELIRNYHFIESALQYEEEHFQDTIERGMKILISEIPKAGPVLAGDKAFKLCDTYGFPLDLTEDILKSYNIGVDREGFDKCMQEQREISKKSWVGSCKTREDSIWFNIKALNGATEFLGYSTLRAESKILALIYDGQIVDAISDGTEFILVTKETPFYAESGGQKGDIGFIQGQTFIAKVIETHKYASNIYGHTCILERGEVRAHDIVSLVVDDNHRANLRRHHTATHLLHATLRAMLGPHVMQKGSLVCHDRLRFDFSHTYALSNAEIRDIEKRINLTIMKDMMVDTFLMPIDKAIELGAMAIFGEKYEDEVRVVSVGSGGSIASMELCGGTHASSTGQLGCFIITGESSISFGVRRIEAVVGEHALQVMQMDRMIIENVAHVLKCNKGEIVVKVGDLFESNKKLTLNVLEWQKKLVKLSTQEIMEHARDVNGISILVKLYHDIDKSAVDSALKECVNNMDDLVLCLGCDGVLMIGVSKNIRSKYAANQIMKYIMDQTRGQGGGNVNFAYGSLEDFSKVEQLVVNYITSL